MSKGSQKRKKLIKPLVIAGTTVFVVGSYFILHYDKVKHLNPRFGLTKRIAEVPSHILHHPFDVFPTTANMLGMLLLFAAGIFFVLFFFYSSEALKHSEDPAAASLMDKGELDDWNKKYTEPIGKPYFEGHNNLIFSENAAISVLQKTYTLNVCAVGGAGVGKSYKTIGPNIMQMNSSMVITDPSGELYKRYGHLLEHFGYRVKCFNVEKMNKSNHYNPFRYIHSNKDVESFVTALMINTTPDTASKGDPFWEKAETALIRALIAYLHNNAPKEQQNFRTIMRLLRQARVDENDSSLRTPIDRMFDDLRNPDPQGDDPYEVAQYDIFKLAPAKTMSGILISVGVRLMFNLPEVQELTNTDDLDLESIPMEKTALFIIVPSQDPTYNFLAALLYSQIFNFLYSYVENEADFAQLIVDEDKEVLRTFRAANQEESETAKAAAEAFFERIKTATVMENKETNLWEVRTAENELVTYRGTKELAEEALQKIKSGKVMSNHHSNWGAHSPRLPIHVSMLLDEHKNTGRIPHFPEKISTMRKYEISVFIIVQSITQLQYLYNKEWSEITGNCDTFMYLGGGLDNDTMEWIVKMLGKETRIVASESYSAGISGNGNTTYSKQGVDLLPIDALRTLDNENCLVIMRSQNALLDKKYNPRRHPLVDLLDTMPYYYHDPKKQLYLDKELHPEYYNNPNITPDTPHGRPVAEPKDVTVAREEKNKDKKERAEQLAANRDENGDPLITERTTHAVENDEDLATTLGIKSSNDIDAYKKQAEKDFCFNMDNDMEIEMDFSSAGGM